MFEHSWSALLEHVEHALVQAEAEARRREEAHPCEAPNPEPFTDADWSAETRRPDEWLRNMQSALHGQELLVQQVERELAASEQAVREWIDAIHVVAKSGQPGQG